MPNKSERITVDVETAAAMLGISTTSIHRLCNDNAIESFKSSNAPNSPRRIYVNSVIAFAKKVQGRVVATND